ncbi:RNA binding protein [Oryctes borbonicus]|uniref:RNA binding protein n=1 Tax=Oryctes borbonicus TaxID=1629725 RepID=A0A0T6BG07_9SCAR|nr:RNA binding protein [Oryctes borbonicus]
MSVIIRLQNLPWSANALDIRQYFHGLSIPEGGVHIVGGELGDAFIAFSTDEDARQAFNLNNGKIKGIQIKLMLSSRTEMQKVIEAARSQSLAAFMQTPTPTQIPAVPPILPPVIPAVPDVKKQEKENNNKDQKVEKRDKRRSRSRSRERKDRSRDRDRRDRRRRERSRSRSRERRERRRRERSRSRDRTRSKERDRRSKDRRTPDKSESQQPKEQKVVWEAPQPAPEALPNLQANLVGTYATLLATNMANPTSLLDPQNSYQNKFVPRWNTNTNDSQSAFQRPRFLTDDRFNDQNQNQGRGRPMNQFNENRGQGFNNRPQQNLGNRMDNNTNSRFSDPQAPEESINSCVRLQPYYGGYGEVRRFFQGIFIKKTGIKFVNDEFGKRTGIVYIRFASPEGKEEALQRNGKLLKGHDVQIRHLEDHIFDETVDRFQPPNDNFSEEDSEDSRFRGKNITKYFRNNQGTPPPKVFSSLLVEDLPTYAKEQDILKIFSDYSLTSIILVNKPRKVHVAYVQFSNTDDAKKALQDVHKHVVDGKLVTVKPCIDEIFENIQREQSEIIDSSMEKQNNFKNSNVLLLTRLPLKTTESDITDFFSDIGITPTKIHLMSSSMGFIGEAFCEFSTNDEARAALDKNSTPLGTSVVNVKSVDRSEMENSLGMNIIEDAPPPTNMNLRTNIMPLMGQQQRPFFPRNNFMSGPRGPNFMGPRPRRFPPPSHQNGAEESFGPPGCTVLMENVPYKATVEEILQFFEGYDIPADNILRRYNPNGKPSGESKVIFKSTDDAYQAVHEKQEQKIRDRTIYLSLC